MLRTIHRAGKYFAIVALAMAGAVMAKEYFLVAFNMSLEADRETEFSSAQNFFSQAQVALNKAGLWRSGDTFIVKYNGNAIAKFKLSTRGMTCAGGKCSWATSVPSDDPEIIQGTVSSAGKTPVVVSVQGGAGVPTTPYLPHGEFYYMAIYNWSIIVGGIPSPGIGGGGGGGGGGPIRIPE